MKEVLESQNSVFHREFKSSITVILLLDQLVKHCSYIADALFWLDILFLSQMIMWDVLFCNKHKQAKQFSSEKRQ